MSLPRLRGPRVTLVPVPLALAQAVVATDGPALEAALRSLGLTAGQGWPHADSADGLRPFAEFGAAGGGDGGWLVVHDGAVVGDCGWRGGPDDAGDCELGYGLAAPARGRGLGTEAVGLLADWAQRQSRVRRLTAEVLVGNEASRRLLTRLGFQPGVVPAGAARGAAAPYLRFERRSRLASDEEVWSGCPK